MPRTRSLLALGWLLAYGTLRTCWQLIGPPPDLSPIGRMDLPEGFFWVAVPAYVVWGATLGVAALAYWRRTRSPEGPDSLPGGMDRRPPRATVEA